MPVVRRPPDRLGPPHTSRRLASVATLAAYPRMLQEDRRNNGFTAGQVAWRLGVKPQEYRELEAGTRSPDFDTWDRICKPYGWPRAFA